MKATMRKFFGMTEVILDSTTRIVTAVGETLTNLAESANDVSKIVKGETAFALEEAQHEQAVARQQFAAKLASLDDQA